MASVLRLMLFTFILGQLMSAIKAGYTKREKQGIPHDFDQLNFKHISCAGNVCYILVETPLTWLTAGATCRRYGGYLAEPKNSVQAAEITKFRKKVSEAHGVWLGGHDLGAEGQWMWQESGDKISLRGEGGFQLWTIGQPNDAAHRNGENCLEAWHTKDGSDIEGWNDAPCDMRLPSICQRPKA